jgi:hypothetical protein
MTDELKLVADKFNAERDLLCAQNNELKEIIRRMVEHGKTLASPYDVKWNQLTCKAEILASIPINLPPIGVEREVAAQQEGEGNVS